jgi:uncharacterized membrane protein YbhN (UPF0104 family)
MRLSPLEAHALCALLVCVDLVARAWRIQWITSGLGHRISFFEAFRLNAYGDAACAVTPLRVGGEPARLAGMLAARVPGTAAAIAILLEVAWAWPVIIVSAAALAWRTAPSWWQTAGRSALRSLTGAWPMIILLLALSVVAWRVGRRLMRRIAVTRNPLRRVAVYWKRMPRWPLLASLPLSFLNLATRTALLPVLALTLPDPPPLGPALLGSFALLYSQLLLPTPSGAGAVDVGFIGGVAGRMGGEGAWLLLAWRFYSNGAGILLGFGLAVQAFGWPALRRMLGGEVRRAVGRDAADN